MTALAYELARCQRPGGSAALTSALAAGLVTAAVCLFVGWPPRC